MPIYAVSLSGDVASLKPRGRGAPCPSPRGGHTVRGGASISDVSAWTFSLSPLQQQ